MLCETENTPKLLQSVPCAHQQKYVAHRFDVVQAWRQWYQMFRVMAPRHQPWNDFLYCDYHDAVHLKECAIQGVRYESRARCRRQYRKLAREKSRQRVDANLVRHRSNCACGSVDRMSARQDIHSNRYQRFLDLALELCASDCMLVCRESSSFDAIIGKISQILSDIYIKCGEFGLRCFNNRSCMKANFALHKVESRWRNTAVHPFHLFLFCLFIIERKVATCNCMRMAVEGGISGGTQRIPWFEVTTLAHFSESHNTDVCGETWSKKGNA